jgi:hypothetical protein
VKPFSRVVASCAPFLVLSGCATSVANLTGANSGSTVLKGGNAAIGGVNYGGTGSAAKEDVWDRHITACRYGSDHRYVFSGDGSDLLSYAPDSRDALVVLHGPAGNVSFPATACSVAKLSLTRAPDAGGGADGKIALVCDLNKHELNASIRFERCGA